jgi:hypothetical protein
MHLVLPSPSLFVISLYSSLAGVICCSSSVPLSPKILIIWAVLPFLVREEERETPLHPSSSLLFLEMHFATGRGVVFGYYSMIIWISGISFGGNNSTYPLWIVFFAAMG